MIVPAPQVIEAAEPDYPRVLPTCIFAAARRSFQVFLNRTIRVEGMETFVKTIIFIDLPLEENGWDRDATQVRYLGKVQGGMYFQVTRAPVSSVFKTDGKNPGTGTPIPSEASAVDFHSSDGAR